MASLCPLLSSTPNSRSHPLHARLGRSLSLALLLCGVKLVRFFDLHLGLAEKTIERPLLGAGLGALQTLDIPVDTLPVEGASLHQKFGEALKIRLVELEINGCRVHSLAFFEELTCCLIPEAH